MNSYSYQCTQGIAPPAFRRLQHGVCSLQKHLARHVHAPNFEDFKFTSEDETIYCKSGHSTPDIIKAEQEEKTHSQSGHTDTGLEHCKIRREKQKKTQELCSNEGKYNSLEAAGCRLYKCKRCGRKYHNSSLD